MTRPAILDVLEQALEIATELDAFGLDAATVERAQREYHAITNADPLNEHERAERGKVLTELASPNAAGIDIEVAAADAMGEILHFVRLNSGDERLALLKGYEYFIEELGR